MTAVKDTKQLGRLKYWNRKRFMFAHDSEQRKDILTQE